MDRHGRKNTIKGGGRKKKNTTKQKLHTSGETRRRFPPYLAGRLTTMKTQRSSFTGREGFAIAAEAKFGGATITIFLSSISADGRVRLFTGFSPLCDALRTPATAGPRILTRHRRTVEPDEPKKNGLDAGKSAPSSQRSRRFSSDRQLTRP